MRWAFFDEDVRKSVVEGDGCVILYREEAQRRGG
jgi:hypothetical protein